MADPLPKYSSVLSGSVGVSEVRGFGVYVTLNLHRGIQGCRLRPISYMPGNSLKGLSTGEARLETAYHKVSSRLIINNPRWMVSGAPRISMKAETSLEPKGTEQNLAWNRVHVNRGYDVHGCKRDYGYCLLHSSPCTKPHGNP